jgi:hypothetical protein
MVSKANPFSCPFTQLGELDQLEQEIRLKLFVCTKLLGHMQVVFGYWRIWCAFGRTCHNSSPLPRYRQFVQKLELRYRELCWGYWFRYFWRPRPDRELCLKVFLFWGRLTRRSRTERGIRQLLTDIRSDDEYTYFCRRASSHFYNEMFFSFTALYGACVTKSGFQPTPFFCHQIWFLV